MALPFVLAGKGALAPGKIEYTEESSRVCLSGVALETGCVLEWYVLAGLACKCTCLGLWNRFGGPGAFWRLW